VFITNNIKASNVAISTNDNRSLTYRQLDDYGDSLKNKMGEKKCIILFLCDSSIETLRAFFGILQCQYVPIMIDRKCDTELVLNLLEKYRPRYIWAKKEDASKFQGCSQLFSEGDYTVYQTNYSYYPIFSDLAILLSTSGTTGSPKLVRLSYKNILVGIKSAVKVFGVHENDSIIFTLPLDYCYGIVCLLIHFHAGAKVLLTDKNILDKEFWELFEDQRVTAYYGVPFTYNILLKIGFFDKKYQHLRYIVQAGGLPSKKVFDEYLAKQGIESYAFYNLYGQTETVVTSYLPPKNFANKYGSVGLAFPEMKVSLIQRQDYKEVVINGDNVFMGYANEYKDLSLGDVNNGVSYTGDIGEFDTDGYLYLKGRVSRFSKLAGVRVGFDDVETLLKSEFQHTDFACIGNDEYIEIFYCLDIEPKEIISFLSNKIRVNKMMIKAYKIDGLPRSGNGKIRYGELKFFLKQSS